MGRILEITDLTTEIALRHSTVQAVGNVDLYVEQGETLGVVGESGCGKSMTGLSIMGLLPPGGSVVSGSIRLDGEELVGISQSRLRQLRGNDMAMIFQDSQTSLNPTRTIGDQVSEPIRLHRGLGRRDAEERTLEVLDLVGMPRPRERLSDYPHQLSGGLRQRVMIATALACDPKLLIADEPTTALDVTIQAQILRLLDRLKDELGMAILLITHDMGVVAGRADRVNVMYAGRMVESTDTRSLFTNMRHPYSQRLLASIPRLESDPSLPLFSIPGAPPDLTSLPPGCRFAPRCGLRTDTCIAQEPPLEGTPGHLAACWHPVNGPVPASAIPPVDAGLPDESATAARGGALTRSRGGEAAEGLTDPTAPVLTVNDVVKEYPVTAGAILRRKVGSVKAVSGVSLSVRPGGTFGLVGESGCGKSTLGRLIVALEQPDSGSVLLEGQPVSQMHGSALRHRRRDLQLMFQDSSAALNPRMRVGELLREPLAIQGVGSRREQQDQVAAILNEVGLPGYAVERYPHEFSGGQRQRIGLARAMILQPKVIVADEPVSALDVSIRSQVLNLMKRTQHVRRTALVVISHDLAVVRYLADEIGVMYLGKLVEVGPSETIHTHAAHPYTAGLLKAIPEPDPDVEKAKDSPGVSGELPSPVNPPSGCRFRTRCPLAADKCAEEEPPMLTFGPGHSAACHFPLQTPVADLPGPPASAGASSPGAVHAS